MDLSPTCVHCSHFRRRFKSGCQSRSRLWSRRWSLYSFLHCSLYRLQTLASVSFGVSLETTPFWYSCRSRSLCLIERVGGSPVGSGTGRTGFAGLVWGTSSASAANLATSSLESSKKSSNTSKFGANLGLSLPIMS